jgi:flagellar biosynthesis protein FliQ
MDQATVLTFTKSIIVVAIIFVIAPFYLYSLARLLTLAIMRSIQQVKENSK